MSYAEQVRTFWISQEIPVNPGLAVEDIKTFEATNKIVLPSDFVEYLTVVNGMGDRAMDSELDHFMPVDALNVWDGNLTFADWSIEAAIFILKLSQSPAAAPLVMRWSDSVEKQVAGAFS